MHKCDRGWAARILIVFFAALASVIGAYAQDQPAPRVEVYGGYSWYDPGARLDNAKLKGYNHGFEVAPTYFFNKYFGATLQANAHYQDRANIATIMVGPTAKLRLGDMEPFIHALGGLHRVVPQLSSPSGTDNG